MQVSVSRSAGSYILGPLDPRSRVPRSPLRESNNELTGPGDSLALVLICHPKEADHDISRAGFLLPSPLVSDLYPAFSTPHWILSQIPGNPVETALHITNPLTHTRSPTSGLHRACRKARFWHLVLQKFQRANSTSPLVDSPPPRLWTLWKQLPHTHKLRERVLSFLPPTYSPRGMQVLLILGEQ